MSRSRVTAPPPERILGKTDLTAVWHPHWYDLDQPIAVDRRGIHQFAVRLEQWEEESIRRWQEHPPDIVFFSGLASDGPWFELDCEVVSIHSSQFGSVRSIESAGLHYVLHLERGEVVTVNCEECPGALWDEDASSWQTAYESRDWTMRVGVRVHG